MNEETDDRPVSDQVALRIGLAARTLKVDIAELVEVLMRILGENIDEDSLQKVTVTQLKVSFGRAPDVEGDEEFEQDARAEDILAYKDAVRFLWGEGEVAAEEGQAVQLEGRMHGVPHVRVAVASNRGEELDGHFGSATRFLVYDVSDTNLKLVEVRSAAGAEKSDDRNGYRVELISDCKILYVVHAGGPAAAKVIKADIHLISVPEGGGARQILGQLQKVIAGSPPPWLLKSLRQGEALSSS